jgi:Low psii accumulation1 / Rep27
MDRLQQNLKNLDITIIVDIDSTPTPITVSTMKTTTLALLLIFLLEIHAFLPNGGSVTTTNFRAAFVQWHNPFSIGHQNDAHPFPRHPHGRSGITSTELYSSNEGKTKKKKGLDENLRNKLVTESIAPWRTVRLFLYFSCGSGALIGGLITLTGFIAALSNGKEDLNVNTEVRQK